MMFVYENQLLNSIDNNICISITDKVRNTKKFFYLNDNEYQLIREYLWR